MTGIIRTASIQDLDAIDALESTCFPQAEAASRDSLLTRLKVFPDQFWMLEEDGRLVSLIDGLSTDLPDLTDRMYEDASMHDPNGKWLMIFGVETAPEYQGKGLASLLMHHVIEEMKKCGKEGIVLTCKEALIPFYSQFGYINEGVSESDHGGVIWYQMRLTF